MTRDEEWYAMVGEVAQGWMLRPADDEDDERAKALLRGYFVRHLRINRHPAPEVTAGTVETA